MKKNILFITDRGDDRDGGLAYALDLARMMDKGISILLVQKNRLKEKFENLMSAVTFAEAGEPETARKFLGSPDDEAELTRQFRESGLTGAVHSTADTSVRGLEEYVKANRNIDLILLAPSIVERGMIPAKDFRKLLRAVSRPIVTLNAPAPVA